MTTETQPRMLPLTPATLLRLGMAIGGAMKAPSLPDDAAFIREHMRQLLLSISEAT